MRGLTDQHGRVLGVARRERTRELELLLHGAVIDLRSVFLRAPAQEPAREKARDEGDECYDNGGCDIHAPMLT